MKILNDYFRLVIFSVGLLVGMQIPTLVDQYSKRVEAKLLESQQSLSGFQLTADRYFQGDMAQLIQHYLNSSDQVFKQDAENIKALNQRVNYLLKEHQALAGNSIMTTFYVLFKHDSLIMQETLASFTYAIVLNPYALLWGLSTALLFGMILEGGCIHCVALVLRRNRKAHITPH